MSWYFKVLQNYAGFQGRARRKEYWMFVLINVIISFVLSILQTILDIESWLTSLYSLAILLPSIAVTARRLHDTGRTGWWQLIALIPLIGAIILIVFLVHDSDAHDNKYGPLPKI
ncbi:DUF805 domain-containing protein [Peribacillus sp. SCS-155]|uniref:DUF805 domain-containing protein n=1 Tax=Peribacillus sedimenti TaxID=3115297 RepID=UPI00390624A4